MDAEAMAKEAAKELRKRGIWACVDPGMAPIVRCSRPADFMAFRWHSITNPDFAGMTALEIADEIQTREVRRAQEWAGDT